MYAIALFEMHAGACKAPRRGVASGSKQASGQRQLLVRTISHCVDNNMACRKLELALHGNQMVVMGSCGWLSAYQAALTSHHNLAHSSDLR
jgi:hypothetical protein